jgi:DAK2 domain fusion protein YloV
VLDSLDASAVRTWCATALASLRRHQREIDQLNVYPVPDGDTGTNLVLTVTAAHLALEGSPEEHEPPGGAMRRMARGALLGARGNSGVIVSQILKGMADALADAVPARGRALTDALVRATTSAYDAVAAPVEGTILTVVRAASEAARACDSDDLPTVVRAAATEAVAALARTPEQLPVLARAGVVDAGGRGLVVLLEALGEVVGAQASPAAAGALPGPVPAGPPTTVRETGSSRYAYEVQYLLEAPAAAVPGLRGALVALGDSVVIVGGEPAAPGGDPVWNVHAHVNDVGAAIEAGLAAGRPSAIAVTRFDEQIADAATGGAVAGAAPSAVVAVVSGAPLARLLRAEGVVVVPGPRPATAQILAAVRGCGAARVVVLPNDPDTRGVAALAAAEARRDGVDVRVVPTRSPVQGLAALAVRDPGRPFEDDVIAMADAAGACRYAAVTTATREALTMAGRCAPGDVLALVDGEVNLIGRDLVATSRALLDRMLAAGGELVTLLTGQDAPEDLAGALTTHLATAWPFTQVQVHEGGQPHYPVVVGVE